MNAMNRHSLSPLSVALLLAMLVAGSVRAQLDTCQFWRTSSMVGVRSAGLISNVSCVGDHLFFRTADILFSRPLSGGMAEPDTIYAPLDREMNYVVRNPASGTVYYTKRTDRRSQLYEIYTDRKGLRHTRQVKLDHFRGSIVHPTFSPDGTLMVFASDADRGEGGYDLWYSYFDSTSWQKPLPLGPRVNSPNNEIYPTIWRDFLFFSSNRANSADYDLYCTRLISTSQIHGDTFYSNPIGLSPLQRMPAPLNSSRNDFSIAFPSQGSGAYFVDRPNDAPADRICRLQGSLPCVIYQGTVLNEQSQLPIPHATLTILDPNHSPAYTAQADSLGRYRLYLPLDSTLEVCVAAPNHLSLTERISARSSNPDLLHSSWTYNPTLTGYPLHRKIPLQAQSIFGSESGSDLTPEGATLLDPIARFARENPHLKLTITAVYSRHRSDSYCTLLNRSRLQSLLQHLAKQGLRAADIDTRSTVGSYQRTSTDNALFDNVILFQFD